MGSTTLTQFVNSVFAKIDESAISDNAVNAKTLPEVIRTVDDLNDAYAMAWKELYGTLRPQAFDVLTTQAGVAGYALTPSLSALNTQLVSQLGTEQPLFQTNLELISRQAPLTEMGAPTCWYRYNDMIAFYPIPNAAYQYRVMGSLNFTKLSAAADTSVFPDEHDILLKHYAIATAKAFWKDADGQYFYDLFKKGLDSLKAAALRAGPRRTWTTDLGDGLNYPKSSFLGDIRPETYNHYDC